MTSLFNLIKNSLIICIIGPLYILGFIFGYCLRAFLNGGFAGYIYEHNLDILEQSKDINDKKGN